MLLWSDVIIGKCVLTVSNYLHKGPLSIPAPLNEGLPGLGAQALSAGGGGRSVENLYLLEDRAADASRALSRRRRDRDHNQKKLEMPKFLRVSQPEHLNRLSRLLNLRVTIS
jgi:hypothetical protein